MFRADKFYGPDRQVLANISLSFLPGAKIGVLGPERRRQVDAAADHGRPRGAVLGRGAARARRDGRPPGAGAGARPRQGRPWERRGRRPRRSATCSTGSTRSLPAFAEPDADFDALLAEQAPRPGRDRPHGRVDARRDARPRDGRAATPGRRPRRDHAVGRRTAARRALPAAAHARPTCSCSTSRRTISTRSRSPGSSGSSPNTPARSWR